MTASHLDEWMRFIEEWRGELVRVVGVGAVGVVLVGGAGDY